jgi:hypothetical protein
MGEANPFKCKHFKLCHSLPEVNTVPVVPKVGLASMPNLEDFGLPGTCSSTGVLILQIISIIMITGGVIKTLAIHPNGGEEVELLGQELKLHQSQIFR